MFKRFRWDPCIHHVGKVEIMNFISHFFDKNKSVLFIAGAGFDQRATVFPSIFSECANKVKSHAFLIREERPSPANELITLAKSNEEILSSYFHEISNIPITIFKEDGAVVGGRFVASCISKIDFSEYTDIIVDISALSIGITFPIIKILTKYFECGHLQCNIHIVVTHQPTMDGSLERTPAPNAEYIHGFKGGMGLDDFRNSIILWLPQVSCSKKQALIKIHDMVKPHDTCPILPFPATNPLLGDKTIRAFLREFEYTWSVDSRDILYAAENDPLMLYKRILDLDNLRKPVFQPLGGSILVLSPIGSKLLALGGLLAALERDLPVAYLETLRYSPPSQPTGEQTLHHIWLEGKDVYPFNRPSLTSYNKR